MNKTDLLASLLILLDSLKATTDPHEPTVVDGFVLVELTDGNAVYDEGVRQHNALVMPQMREMLRNSDMVVWSMRNAETDVSVLSLSVSSDGVCRHVVGKHNAAPSADQLDILYRLLAKQGFELQYNPFSVY